MTSFPQHKARHGNQPADSMVGNDSLSGAVSGETLAMDPNGRSAEDNEWRLEVAIALSRAGYQPEADEFLDCQDPDTLRWYRVCEADPDHYAKPCVHTCHKRYCPECAKREVGRLLKRYLPPIELAVATGPEYYRLRKIEFTTPYSLRSDDARERYIQMWKAVSKVFDLLLGDDWYKKGMGYIGSAEFGELGLKLHFHILFYGSFIRKRKLSEVWEEVTNGDCQVTYIREVTPEEGAKEVLKYSTKFTQLAPGDIPQLMAVLKGTRRIRSRGIFYNPPEMLPEPFCCPECGSPIVRMYPSQYDQWREARRSRALDVLASLTLKMQSLDLKHGNKSPPTLPGFEEIMKQKPYS